LLGISVFYSYVHTMKAIFPIQAKDATLVILLATVIVLALLQWKGCGDLRDANTTISSLDKSLEITKDSLGKQTATLNDIAADYSTLRKINFAKQDSLAAELKKIVKRNTLNASVAKTVVELRDTFYVVEQLRDTLDPNDSCGAYYFPLNSRWYTGWGIAHRNYAALDLEIPVGFSIETSRDRRLFKPDIVKSELKFDNPLVKIKDVRTYTVRCDCKQKAWTAFAIGAASGVGATIGVDRLTN